MDTSGRAQPGAPFRHCWRRRTAVGRRCAPRHERVAQRTSQLGYSDLAKLAVAVERNVTAKRAADTPVTTTHTTTATAAPEVAATPA
jgi:hypothetical protein